MLKTVVAILLMLIVAGAIYEFTLVDRDILRGRKVLRVGAAGWMIQEFNLHEQVRRFEKDHPDIHIKLEQNPVGFDTVVMLQASMGQLAFDLVLGPGNYVVEKYQTRGLAVPLESLVPAEFQERMIPSMLKCSRVDGKLYIVPFMGEVNVLLYRKDLFEAAGLTRLPETWEEFEAYAEKLSDPNARQYGISLDFAQDPFFTQNTYMAILGSIRGSVVDENGHLDLSSPESRQVFRMLKRWWKKGLVSPNCKSGSGASDDFTSGLTAMYPNWQSRGIWVSKNNERLTGMIGFAPIPGAKKNGSLIAVHGGLILRDSELRHEAGLFLAEAMCGYAQPAIIQAGKMPVTRDGYDPKRFADFVTKSGGKLPEGWHYPEWIPEVGKTLPNSFAAPEASLFSEVSDYVAPAFHEYLDSDSDDPAPFLEQARRLAHEKIYSRQD